MKDRFAIPAYFAIVFVANFFSRSYNIPSLASVVKALARLQEDAML
jgi:hypothetical protein